MIATEPSQHVYGIDFLTDIPEEATQTGPVGRAYWLQIIARRAEHKYESTREMIWEDYDRQVRAGRTPLGNPDDSQTVRAARETMEQAQGVRDAAQAEIGGLALCFAKDNLPKAEKALAALNRKGLTEPITLTVTNETVLLDYTYFEHNFGGDYISEGGTFEHVYCILNGETPMIPGFTLLATLSPTDAGNVVIKIPVIRYQVQHGGNDEQAQAALDAIDLSRFRTTGNICEHCNKDIATRKNIFVVYNAETGETKQVGRSCLKDYTGANNPEKILKAMEQYFEFIRMATMPGEKPSYSMEFFLTHAACLVRTYGFEKGDYKTGDSAMRNIVAKAKKQTDRQGGPQWIDPTPADEQRAKAAIKWAREEWDPRDDFGINVKIVVSNDILPERKENIAAWVFPKMEGEISRKLAAQENATKEFIGEVKQRLTLTLTVKAIKWVPDNYSFDQNEKPLYIMEDEKGNSVKWFASDVPAVADKTNAPLGPVEDGTYQVKATVKRHDENDRFGKSTIVNRCKFEKTVSEPEEEN